MSELGAKASSRKRMEMASFLIGSVAEAEEMEKAMAPPSRVMSPTLCSLKESLVPSSSRSPSARSEARSAASCQDLNFTAKNMLDAIVRMAHSASRSSPDHHDDKRD